MFQHPAQAAAIQRQHAVEDFFAGHVKAAMLFLALVFQQVRAHHRRRGQRDDHRHEDGRRKSDGKLAEETANDSTHHQKRDENGDERNADGEDGVSDFLRALQRRGEGLHSIFEMAGNVFHHHDGIVDHKSRGDCQCHQREVVETVVEQIHHCERTNQRDRHRNGGNERGTAIAQKNKHDNDDESDGNDQRALDVADRGADGCGAIKNDGGVDTERNRCLD